MGVVRDREVVEHDGGDGGSNAAVVGIFVIALIVILGDSGVWLGLGSLVQHGRHRQRGDVPRCSWRIGHAVDFALQVAV